MRLAIYQLKNTKKVVSLIADNEDERDTIKLCMPARMVYNGNGKLYYAHTEGGHYHTIAHRYDYWQSMCKLGEGADTAPHMRLSPVTYKTEGESLVLSLPEEILLVKPRRDPVYTDAPNREPEAIRLDQAVRAVNHCLSIDDRLEPVIENGQLVVYKTTRRRVV